MSIINQLASSLGRRDEVPNQELAAQIIQEKNKESVRELIENLFNKSKDIQHDCIKVVYEIAAVAPEMISPYHDLLFDLLKSKNNRMQWGAMTALSAITTHIPDSIFIHLPDILDVANKGSVISKDNLIAILIGLATVPAYHHDAVTLILEQLRSSLPNQLPMYAENVLPVITDHHKDLMIMRLTSRLADVEKDSKRKRIEKVIKKLSGKDVNKSAN